MLRGVVCGFLFRISDDGSVARIDAAWPRLVATRDGLLQRVLVCAEHRRPYREEVSPPSAGESATLLRLYQPVRTGVGLFVAVLEMENRSEAEQRTVVNFLRWNSEWLSYAFSRQPSSQERDISAMFSIAVTALERPTFRGAATAMLTELAARFSCHRVSIGLRRGRRLRVELISHSAQLKQETNLVQALAAAMDEATDQDRTVLFPPPADSPLAITHAHRALAEALHEGSVGTVPISERGELVGAVTLERDAAPPLSDAELRQVELMLALLTPALWLKLENEKGLHRKAWRSLKESGGRLLGRGHARLKLGVLVLAALLGFFWLGKGDWRVTADAVVEGRVQRTIAAPIDGYIASADARAGDMVTAGQQIGTLDDSDLRLQRLKWSTLRQQMISELRDARARNSRAEVSIVTAKIEQANAELELIDEQLGRTRLASPLDGIVIAGDLSQRLGTPVQRGDELFKIAPLDDYRIVLHVDERDVAAVQPGLAGRLVLASAPDRPIRFEVSRVTPVSTAAEGRNVFRIEARPIDAQLSLQPGMEGVGKITVGEARLIWIWTHDLVHWLRLQAWTWWR